MLDRACEEVTLLPFKAEAACNLLCMTKMSPAYTLRSALGDYSGTIAPCLSWPTHKNMSLKPLGLLHIWPQPTQNQDWQRSPQL